MICYLTKISHPADLDYCYFNLELTIELYWWQIKCLLRNMLLKIASYGTCHIIIESPSIFNAKLKSIRAKRYLCNRWLLLIQTWWYSSLYTTDWFSALIIFHGPNFLTTGAVAQLSDSRSEVSWIESQWGPHSIYSTCFELLPVSLFTHFWINF